MTDDDGFIGLPPGMSLPTDSGTVKRARPARDEIVFFPAAPGAPAPAPVAEPVQAPTPVAEPVEAPTPAAEPVQAPTPVAEPVEAPTPVAEPAETVAEETRFSGPVHSAPAWRIAVAGQGTHLVEGRLFVGRNPVAPREHPDASVLSLGADQKSVSKTHALLEVDEGALWVHDLDSTNGVWVLPPQMEPIEVEPGTRARVAPGSDIEIGDVVIQVEHG